MSKHTPGPWNVTVNYEDEAFSIDDSLGFPIAIALKIEANARLIAAAPDLLEACKLALSSCEPHSVVHRKISDAVTKAEGDEK